MAKLTLDIEYDYDFVLYGISSPERDYRLCWALNNTLNISLSKTTALEIKDKKQLQPAIYTIYAFDNKDTFIEYFLIVNRGEGGVLVPEQKMADYFLLVRGNMNETDKNSVLKKIKELQLVQTVFLIDPNTLKSKQNLLF